MESKAHKGLMAWETHGWAESQNSKGTGLGPTLCWLSCPIGELTTVTENVIYSGRFMSS
jgi:hypothetical protein